MLTYNACAPDHVAVRELIEDINSKPAILEVKGRQNGSEKDESESFTHLVSLNKRPRERTTSQYRPRATITISDECNRYEER